MQFNSQKDRIFIALDVPGADDAKRLIDKLGDEASSYKVGLQLFCSAGPQFVKDLAGSGLNVFLDLKFHDIPNTVAGAIRSVSSLGVKMLNVHCSGGPEMLSAARQAIPADEDDSPAILGVTVLTSLDDENLKELGIAHTSEGQVLLLARMAKEAGLEGVICSPREIDLLRSELGEDFLLITPGVRPAWASAGDQKRITTPKDAFDNGASAIVIGRPITGADDSVAAMRRLLEEIG